MLTLRAESLPKHANQVSLPGGAVEPEESPADAALREAWEEISVDPAEVRIAGELSPLHIPVSGFVLHPFVGTTERRPEFEPDPREVARILEIPLDRLTDPATLREEGREFRGRTYRVPYFDVGGVKVWGATAMILSEFLTLIGEPPPPAPAD